MEEVIALKTEQVGDTSPKTVEKAIQFLNLVPCLGLNLKVQHHSYILCWEEKERVLNNLGKQTVENVETVSNVENASTRNE